MTRVLILDDRPINRQFLTTLLAYKGFETREAGDGAEGLEVARQWPPDLAIVDIAMPVMDGVEFVRRLHDDPALAATPIIFYTASYEAADAQRMARDCGVAYVLTKPSDPEVILQRIDDALGRPSAPAAAAGDPVAALQSEAMRTGALIDFHLEIAAQRCTADILHILARAARNIVASEQSSVAVNSTIRTIGEAAGPDTLRVPLETAAKRYGWLTLSRTGAYSAGDERIASTLAAQASIAYENLGLYDELRQEAELLDRNVSLLHATIEASGDGILVVDQSSHFVTYNHVFVDVMRVPSEILESGDANASLAFSLRQIREPDRFRATVEAVRAGAEAFGTFATTDGRFIECHGAPRRLNGQIIGRVWSFRDVTAAVRAGEALRESEAKYRSLVANVPDVLWTADSRGAIVYISPNVEALLGFTAEDVRADPASHWFGRIHADDLVRARAGFAALLDEREPFDSEYRVKRSDGKWIWVHARSHATYERDGVVFADGVLHDITARKASEEELRRVAHERELLIESTGDGIFAVDVSGVCTMANRVAAALLGRPIEELVGARIHALVHPSGATFNVAQPERVAGAAFLRRDGAAIPVDYVAAPIVDAGVVRGAVVTFTDITERRRLEQRLEQISRIDSLGRMAATIAHEFNNVLMGIQPFAEVIRRTAGEDARLMKAASQILTSVARGKAITQDILRVARVTEPEVESVDVTQWIEQIAVEIRALVGGRVELELDLPPAQTLFVRCDPSQMQQVLTNLAVNARHAMNSEGTLRFSACRAAEAVQIEVSDTGAGIAPQNLPFIFEPLFTTKQSGTGLGLAVAQQLVIRNGGTIGVDSVVGKGTRFFIDLPEAPPPQGERAPQEPSTLQELGLERVLIVEDDTAVAAGLAAILEGEGVDVRVVETGGEAPAAVATFRPDAVLIDVSLPNVSGGEVYRQIVARWPRMGVVFSTGHADESRLPPMRSDRVRFLRKPYSSDMLLSKLREVV